MVSGVQRGRHRPPRALYHEDATNDAGDVVAQGRDAVRQEIAAALSRSAQRNVRMIARVETGAMHAEWRGREEDPETGDVATSAGYDEFWIENGLIRRQRGVLHPLSFQTEEDVVPSTRRAPRGSIPASRSSAWAPSSCRMGRSCS